MPIQRNYDFGRVRRRARRSAAFDRQGAILLSSLLTVSIVLAVLRGGRCRRHVAIIVTAPVRALAGAPPYYYGYYGQPFYPPPGYYTPGYYAPPYYSGPR